MNTHTGLTSLLVGCALAACDAPPTPDSGRESARYGTYSAVLAKWFWIGGGLCPPSGCGGNSPFIGHELHLDGDLNARDVKFIAASHTKYPGAEVKFEVHDDELYVEVNGAQLEGEDQVGLVLHLNGLLDDGTAVGIDVTLVHVDSDTARMWTNHPDEAHAVPSYKFMYGTDEVDAQLLCPAPIEGELSDLAAVALAEAQLEAVLAGDDNALEALAQQEGPEYHAVVFAGERFNFDDASIGSEGEARWFNWGCAGSSAAKLHLSGHTAAADKRLGTWPPTTLDAKQAMLYAATATYCPGSEQLTDPGHPLRFADARDLIYRDEPWSFDPYAAGTVEGIWGKDGLVCLSVPRLEGVDSAISISISDECGAIPPCPEPAVMMAADVAGTLLSAGQIVTFNPGASAPAVCSVHDRCTTGVALDTGCGSCVASICAVDPYCCATAWDSICVNEVNTVCALSCP